MKKVFLVFLLTQFIVSCGEGENKNTEGRSLASSGNTGISRETQSVGVEKETQSVGIVGVEKETQSVGIVGVEKETQSVKDLFAGVRFVRIPAGSFTMGSPKGEKYRQDNENQVQVEISHSFEIMDKELTQDQWYEVMGKNPSKFKGSKYCSNYDSVKDMCPDHPVEQVSWNETQLFIKRLNKLKGLKGCEGLPSDPRGCYRLPTEAEWEYSARAGATTGYFFGDESQIGNYAVYKENSEEQSQRVGSKLANPWGLYDMSGNVWEWVQDIYQASLPGGKNPLVTTGSNRVLRGGSWKNRYPWYLRLANRDRINPGLRFNIIGFRLVRTL